MGKRKSFKEKHFDDYSISDWNDFLNCEFEAGHDPVLLIKIAFCALWERMKIGFKSLENPPLYLKKMQDKYEDDPYLN